MDLKVFLSVITHIQTYVCERVELSPNALERQRQFLFSLLSTSDNLVKDQKMNKRKVIRISFILDIDIKMK